jgi:hypothetical protein
MCRPVPADEIDVMLESLRHNGDVPAERTASA